MYKKSLSLILLTLIFIFFTGTAYGFNFAYKKPYSYAATKIIIKKLAKLAKIKIKFANKPTNVKYPFSKILPIYYCIPTHATLFPRVSRKILRYLEKNYCKIPLGFSNYYYRAFLPNNEVSPNPPANIKDWKHVSFIFSNAIFLN